MLKIAAYYLELNFLAYILIAYPDDFHITLGIIFSYHCHRGITQRVCDLARRTPFVTPVHYYLVEDTTQVNKIESF
jgi:hypothetical protein